jgi:fructuronate reductase
MARMNARLSAATIGMVPPGVFTPAYDRATLRPRIVHLGLGAFFRAHGALYTEDVLHARGGDWGIAGVSLRRPDQRDRLSPQDGLYTTLSRDGSGTVARVAGPVLSVLVAPENPAAVVARLANPDTAIVTLTITEKGYCHYPATGRLDTSHPDIVSDLANPETSRTAIGFIVAALAKRCAAGQRPFVVMTCDNLPSNGRLLAGLVRDFAASRDTALATWIENTVQFPGTMVDRIVPAPTQADLDEAEQLTGLTDLAAVAHEPFRQWVIEDCFNGNDRPEWELAGARITDDVAPFEIMKLRLLNGAHSALAYLGYLAGHETIYDAISDPALHGFTRRLWDEIQPMVPPPPNTDLRAYTDSLAVRFANPAVRHRTWQIAMDGSQKLPQRLLGTIQQRLRANLPIPALALAIAGWIRYVGGVDETGAPIDVRDPLAVDLRDRATGPDAVRNILALSQVFAPSLAADPGFVTPVTEAFNRLRAQGARGAVAQ